MLSHACYSINTWIQVRGRREKKGKKGKGSALQYACMCGNVRGRECERLKKRARLYERRAIERVMERETETDMSFGGAVSSSTSMSDACAARCRKSGSERREERRRGK